MAMSQKQYIDHHGVKCPYCGGGDVEGQEVTIDAGGSSQEVSCLDCGAVWHDQYRLVGYAFEEIPSPNGLGDGVTEITPEESTDPVAYFAVSGRIPGDNEDTTLTFALTEKAMREDAVKAFDEAIYAKRGIDRESVLCGYGDAVYIQTVLKSPLPIDEV